ncbi:MAG: aminotransferase class I/II-fold pyridoxal phosphate-dependent enzyme [Hymenobacter sp.]
MGRLQPDAPAPDADQEVTITAGATEALYGVLAAVVRPGDEVIILEPAYDLYGPAVRLARRRAALRAPAGPALSARLGGGAGGA